MAARRLGRNGSRLRPFARADYNRRKGKRMNKGALPCNVG